MRGLVILSIAFALMAGCGTQTKLVAPEYIVSISNNSARHIKEIRTFDCQGSDIDGKLLTTVLRRGSSVNIKLANAVECMNLFAFDYDGNVVARQRQVSIPPDFNWIIK